MSALSIIFITVLICAELDFFALLFCKEISEWLNAKSEEIRARAETIRQKPKTEIDTATLPEIPPETPSNPDDETDTEIYKPEGTE